eukprot:TRINITY_DN17143_c0_g1_i1.p1 TRINITY_DN17143_c0_g1~~TRINITY_DN17143_c0_g1_i1.p1  ORF type:complete len:404 (+),score=137.88 TRINITY_DN17143_c0_g1_i1:126-1214(+)
MGTHPSGPSSVVFKDGTKRLLSKYLKDHHEAIGRNPTGSDAPSLPFLFKVLSIAKALSIQAHPDKKLAVELHARNPQNYKDPNHKPEMAMALSQMEALCQFRKIEEIQEFLSNYEEFRNLVGEAAAKQLLAVKPDSESEVRKHALKAVFTQLMNQTQAEVATQCQHLVRELKDKKDATKEEKLILRLNDQFPDDVGIFCVFMLNYITLEPGEALFLAANEPHSYLSGECAECMAESDNVVRAGLTPKAKDVDTLCSMLTYRDGPPPIIKGVETSKFSSEYVCPTEEFLLTKTVLPKGTTYPLGKMDCASIVLVFKGDGMMQAGRDVHQVRDGSILFVPANFQVEIKSTSPTTVLRCSANRPV